MNEDFGALYSGRSASNRYSRQAHKMMYVPSDQLFLDVIETLQNQGQETSTVRKLILTSEFSPEQQYSRIDVNVLKALKTRQKYNLLNHTKERLGQHTLQLLIKNQEKREENRRVALSQRVRNCQNYARRWSEKRGSYALQKSVDKSLQTQSRGDVNLSDLILPQEAPLHKKQRETFDRKRLAEVNTQNQALKHLTRAKMHSSLEMTEQINQYQQNQLNQLQQMQQMQQFPVLTPAIHKLSDNMRMPSPQVFKKASRRYYQPWVEGGDRAVLTARQTTMNNTVLLNSTAFPTRYHSKETEILTAGGAFLPLHGVNHSVPNAHELFQRPNPLRDTDPPGTMRQTVANGFYPKTVRSRASNETGSRQYTKYSDALYTTQNSPRVQIVLQPL